MVLGSIPNGAGTMVLLFCILLTAGAVITATHGIAGRSRTLFPLDLWRSYLFDVFGQTFLMERPSQ